MDKMLILVFAISFTGAPALAIGEDGCNLLKKNEASQNRTIEQVYSSVSFDTKFQENE